MGSMAFDLYNFKWEASPGLGMFDILHMFVWILDLLLTDTEHHCGICGKGLSSMDSPQFKNSDLRLTAFRS
jgi:hypothetical protein